MLLYWHVDNRLPQLAASSLIEEALDRTQRLLDDIWLRRSHEPHLIHGDLTPHNVLVADGWLVPIDFQDLVWGFDVQDIVVTFSSFGSSADADHVRRQFRSGYERIRRWPDLDDTTIAGHIAARRLHQLNLALTLRRPGLSTYVDRALTLIGEWMS